MSTPSSTNTIFGRGAIFFDRFSSTGVQSHQWLHLGNCDNFATSISTDTVNMTDYTSFTSTPYATATKATTVGLKISGFEFDAKVMAVVLSGDTSTYTQSASTVTGETIAAASLTGLVGSYFQTANRNISAITVKQGTVTLVSGTDWSLHSSLTGLVRIIPTSSTVVDGTALTINYTSAALSGATALTTVRGFNAAQVQGAILFVPNNTTGPNLEVRIWNCKLSADGDTSLISDDFAKWNLTGTVVADSAAAYGGSTNEPYMRVTKQA